MVGEGLLKVGLKAIKKEALSRLLNSGLINPLQSSNFNANNEEKPAQARSLAPILSLRGKRWGASIEVCVPETLTIQLPVFFAIKWLSLTSRLVLFRG